MTPGATVVGRLRLDGPIDLRATLLPFRHGLRDPTIRISGGEVWRATRTPEGPATVHVLLDASPAPATTPTPATTWTVTAWGDGAEWAVARAGRFLGADDVRAGFDPEAGTPVGRLDRRFPSMRIAASATAYEVA